MYEERIIKYLLIKKNMSFFYIFMYCYQFKFFMYYVFYIFIYCYQFKFNEYLFELFYLQTAILDSEFYLFDCLTSKSE